MLDRIQESRRDSRNSSGNSELRRRTRPWLVMTHEGKQDEWNFRRNKRYGATKSGVRREAQTCMQLSDWIVRTASNAPFLKACNGFFTVTCVMCNSRLC